MILNGCRIAHCNAFGAVWPQGSGSNHRPGWVNTSLLLCVAEECVLVRTYHGVTHWHSLLFLCCFLCCAMGFNRTGSRASDAWGLRQSGTGPWGWEEDGVPLAIPSCTLKEAALPGVNSIGSGVGQTGFKPLSYYASAIGPRVRCLTIWVTEDNNNNSTYFIKLLW